MENLYQPVGAFYHDNTCDFVVWAPLKKSVCLSVSYPYLQSIPLQKDQSGYWKTSLSNVQPGLRYAYTLDDEITTRPDPASLSQPEGVHLPSEVIDSSFAWTDEKWPGLAIKNAIIYELHVGTFTPEGNFDGVISKLDYLKELGITAVEIMPAVQFPGERNWGYDGVYPFAVQNSYGGVIGLKKLINSAHENGIAIILDVVYNHLGPEGGYLNDFGPYFTTKYKTPWGDAINFDDAYCDGVRSYFLQNALLWLDEFHIDGLRMDAVHAIMDNSARHIMQVLTQKVKKLEESTGKKKFLIAELDLNNPKYISLQSKGGYGLNGQWNDEFHHALHALLTGEKNGYYEDFGALKHLEKAYRDTYVYDGCYSQYRKKIFGVPAKETDYKQFVVFSQNHDHIGNRMLGDRLTTLLPFESLKMAAALVLLSPYIPLLFMGEEVGEKAPFLYFTHHSDQALIKNITEGRKKEFANFTFTGEFPDPQAEETFKKSKLSWNKEDAGAAMLLSLYKYLIQLRKSHKALQGKDRSSMQVWRDDDKNILAIERTNEASSVIIIFHFGKEKVTYTLPQEASFTTLFDSSLPTWNGIEEVTPHKIEAGESFAINPMSVLIFELIK